MKTKCPLLWSAFAVFALTAASLVVGCSADTVGENHSVDCDSPADCADGQSCLDGVCEDLSDVTTDTDPVDDADYDAGPDVGPDAADTDTGDTAPIPDPDCPDPNTCSSESVECGSIADGCGGSVQCGGCPGGHACDAGQCVEVPCTPGGDCLEEGVECGAIADGCGDFIDCGSCDDGEVCGAGANHGICTDEACTPLDCTDLGAECGPMPDGCGDFIDCGSCDAGQTCGVGDERGQCEEISCDTLSCDDYDPGECGPHPDGCGGFLYCGDCDSGEVCGVGDEFGECVEPSCEELTCDDYDDINCGPMPDGCGGMTDDCGSCEGVEICGGGGVPNVCGAGTGQDGCENLCEDQVICSGGEATTLTGTVVAPNGELPIPNAVVYVPNVPLDQLPPIESGAICQQCEDEDLGEPLVGTITEYDGTFELRHVPAGVSFPLVIKIGQWRRVVTISPRDACEEHALDSEQTRLPTMHQEGSVHDHIPQMAITTGAVDAMECVFHKLGVEEFEFTRPNQDGRIHLYRANGGVVDQELSNACANASMGSECFWCGFFTCCYDGCGYDICTDRDPGSCLNDSGGQLLQQNLSHNLYGDQSQLDSYDMVVMGCEANEHSRTSADRNRLLNYVNAGGRLFASHYAYDWLHETDELSETATWGGGEDFVNSSLAYVDDTFPGGSVFRDWLHLPQVDAAHSTTTSGQTQVEIIDPRTYVTDVDQSKANRWVYTVAGASGHLNRNSIQQYTFDTPVPDDPADQCGQVAYSAFHVAGADTRQGPAFPSYCESGSLTDQEKILAYMLFDLAACVSEDGEPPEPECEPRECDDLSIECGVASDGCGGVTDNCGDCPDGTACGAGGVPNMCGGDCTPMSCEDHGADCGIVDDGCGGTVDCGDCPDGSECGASGTPNMCECQAMSCEDHGAECGEVSDGCGNTLNCGDCPDGQTCGGGGSPNTCGGGCAALNCDDHDVECGTVADGCGGTIDCGDCPEPETCGGGGEANTCGCSPLSCTSHNAECGEVADGCGDTLDCGECPGFDECIDNQCVTPACLPDGDTCVDNAQCCSEICAISSGDDEGTCISN